MHKQIKRGGMNTLARDDPKYTSEAVILINGHILYPTYHIESYDGKLESGIRNSRSIFEARGKRLVEMPADKENVMHLRIERTSVRRAFVRRPPLRISPSSRTPSRTVHRRKFRTLNPAEPLPRELKNVHPTDLPSTVSVLRLHRMFLWAVIDHEC